MTGIFNDTSYYLLSIVAVANGLSYDLLLWLSLEQQNTISPVVILAIFTLTYLQINHPFSNTKLAVPCTILIFASLIPSTLIAWLGLFIAAAWRYVHATHRKERFILWMGIAFSFFWQSCLFKVTSGLILPAETWLIGLSLKPFFPDLTIFGNHIVLSDDHALSIGLGCSCFSHFSVVLLGWASVYFLRGEQSFRWHWPITLLAILISLNIARVGLMAINYDTYIMIHDGVGVVIYDTIISLIIASALFISPPQTTPYR